MNYDAAKLAELREQRRSNLAKEEIEASKAESAARTAKARMGEVALKAATGIATLAGRNDIRWDAPSLESLKKAGRLSYVTRRFGTPNLSGHDVRKVGFTLVKFQPMLGYADGINRNAAWLAFKAIYDAVRGKNRGSTNYTVNDLIHFFFPTLTITAAIASYERLFKLVRQYSIHEGYVGKAMVEALGFSYDDILANLPSLEDQVSILKTQLALIPLPKEFNCLKRWVWLNSYVFADSCDQVRQYYIPCINVFHSINTSGLPYYTAPQQLLQGREQGTPTQVGISSILTELSAMSSEITRIVSDTTFQAISGDIYNYYGTENLAQLNAAVDYEEDPIIYDQEFLLQFANADFSYSAPSLLMDQFGLSISDKGIVGQGVFDVNHEHQGIICFNDLEKSQHDNDAHVIRPIFEDELSDEETFMACAFAFTNTASASGGTYYYFDPSATPPAWANATYTGNWFHLTSVRTELIVWVCSFETAYQAGDNGARYMQAHELLTTDEAAVVEDLDIQPKLLARYGSSSWIWFNELDTYAVAKEVAINNLNAIALFSLWNIPINEKGYFSSSEHAKARSKSKNFGGKDRKERGNPKPHENH